MNYKNYFNKSTFSKFLCKISELYTYPFTIAIILTLLLNLSYIDFLLLIGIYYLLDRIHCSFNSKININYYITTIFLLTLFISVITTKPNTFVLYVHCLSVSIIIALVTIILNNVLIQLRDSFRH